MLSNKLTTYLFYRMSFLDSAIVLGWYDDTKQFVCKYYKHYPCDCEEDQCLYLHEFLYIPEKNICVTLDGKIFTVNDYLISINYDPTSELFYKKSKYNFLKEQLAMPYLRKSIYLEKCKQLNLKNIQSMFPNKGDRVIIKISSMDYRFGVWGDSKHETNNNLFRNGMCAFFATTYYNLFKNENMKIRGLLFDGELKHVVVEDGDNIIDINGMKNKDLYLQDMKEKCIESWKEYENKHICSKDFQDFYKSIDRNDTIIELCDYNHEFKDTGTYFESEFVKSIVYDLIANFPN